MKLIEEVRLRITHEINKDKPNFDLLRIDVLTLKNLLEIVNNPKDANQIFMKEHILWTVILIG